MKNFISLFLFLAVALPAGAQTGQSQPVATSKFELKNNWSIQSSAKIQATGEVLSTAAFKSQGWYRASVPTTVLAALVQSKVFPDPYFGMNLRSIPGTSYPVGDNFSNLPMPPDSPFAVSWWYRTEFRLPAAYAGKHVWLNFDGINYRANVWLNGHKIASTDQVAGTFRGYEFNISTAVEARKANVLAVEVFAPGPDDLAITWVDWNPAPPDKDMGLWRDVYLTASGPVALRNPFVGSKLDAEHKTAALTISADLRNATDHAVKGVLKAQVEGARVSQPVELQAGETKTVRFDPAQYTELTLAHPRLWWPYQMGSPNMYVATLQFESTSSVSDSASVHFGVREVTSELTDQGGRLFKINGHKILIRGGGWSSDMLLRWSPERIKAEFDYVKDMGLNAIRQEGKLERDEYFEMADRMGILIMPGWCCCDMWEHWGRWQAEHYQIARASLESEIHHLRNHPSVFVWLYGSDNPPPADVETMYLEVLKNLQWPNPAVSSASQKPTAVTGPSGVKMTGPYDYVPPNYWLADKAIYGGAYGFNTETGPGPAIPPLESLKRFLPPDHLWPMDDFWMYHSGGERFKDLNIFNNALTQRYGAAENLDDYLRKSQAIAYEGQRAMFEAYARNKYKSAGVIQWMLNNAWPSLIWHLYDYYLVPAGGYFGTKKACEMAHVQYSYDDDSVAVINGYDRALAGMKVTARIYDLNAQEKGSREATLDLPPDSSTKAFDLPKISDLPSAYFLRLELRDTASKLVSDNFYWLSSKADVLDWAKTTDTVYTPQSDYADLTALRKLPQVKLSAHATTAKTANGGIIRVVVRSPSKDVAFMVHFRATKGPDGEDITPIFWDDNYISLLPGETRHLEAKFGTATLGGAQPAVEVDGWNIAPAKVALQP